MTTPDGPAFRALLLDLGGVVFPSPFELHGVAERHYGLRPGTLQWHGPFDPAGDALWQDQQAGRITEREYWRLRAEEVEGLAGRNGGVREYLTVCYQDGDEVLRPELLSLVDDVRAAGIRVGVLSNDAEAFLGREWMNRSAFLATIEAFVDGSTTGILKPDPAAYRLAVEALKVEPHEILFVDDQPANVAGALQEGLGAFRFDLVDVAGSVALLRQRLGVLRRADAS